MFLMCFDRSRHPLSLSLSCSLGQLHLHLGRLLLRFAHVLHQPRHVGERVAAAAALREKTWGGGKQRGWGSARGGWILESVLSFLFFPLSSPPCCRQTGRARGRPRDARGGGGRRCVGGESERGGGVEHCVCPGALDRVSTLGNAGPSGGGGKGGGRPVAARPQPETPDHPPPGRPPRPAGRPAFTLAPLVFPPLPRTSQGHA